MKETNLKNINNCYFVYKRNLYYKFKNNEKVFNITKQTFQKIKAEVLVMCDVDNELNLDITLTDPSVLKLTKYTIYNSVCITNKTGKIIDINTVRQNNHILNTFDLPSTSFSKFSNDKVIDALYCYNNKDIQKKFFDEYKELNEYVEYVIGVMLEGDLSTDIIQSIFDIIVQSSGSYPGLLFKLCSLKNCPLSLVEKCVRTEVLDSNRIDDLCQIYKDKLYYIVLSIPTYFSLMSYKSTIPEKYWIPYINDNMNTLVAASLIDSGYFECAKKLVTHKEVYVRTCVILSYPELYKNFLLEDSIYIQHNVIMNMKTIDEVLEHEQSLMVKYNNRIPSLLRMELKQAFIKFGYTKPKTSWFKRLFG